MSRGRLSLFAFPDMYSYKKALTSFVSAHIGLKLLTGAHVGSATPLRYPPIRMKFIAFRYFIIAYWH
jgi:hypothetical protein